MTFFERYLKYVENTEPPVRFHEWTALSCVGAMASKRVYLSMGAYPVTPTQLIVLVSASALARKSSALNLGYKLVTEALALCREKDLDIGLPVAVNKITPAALLSLMGGTTENLGDISLGSLKAGHSRPVYLCADELGNFLPDSQQGTDLCALITELYTWDSKGAWTNITKTQGTDSIQQPCLNMLACVQPKLLINSVSESLFSQGFVGRCLYIYEEKPTVRIPFPTLDESLHDDLVKDLARITLLEGEAQLSFEARQWYVDWYMALEDVDNDESGFVGRKQTHLLKGALNRCLARHELIVQKKDLEDSHQALTKVAEDLPTLFRFVRRSDEREGLRIVEGTIQGRGAEGISTTDFRNEIIHFMKYSQAEELLEDLQHAKKIFKSQSKPKGRGRPKSNWIHMDFFEAQPED